MTFASNLFLTGELQKNAFQSALDDALLLHPLLHAIVKPVKQGKPCWVASKQPPVVDWGGIDDPIQLHEAIDLRSETGLRIWVRTGNGKSRIIFQFHHASSDGTGAHRFIGDVLAGYGIRTCDDRRHPEIAEYDSNLLRARRSKLCQDITNPSLFRILKSRIGHAMQVFAPKIAPLRLNGKSTSDAEPVPDAIPAVVSHLFDREQHNRLRQSASCQGVMLNDLLMAELFHTMRWWNVEHGAADKGRLRIMMPSDMRDKECFAMSAANMTSYNFITRKMTECDDERSLLKGLRNEIAQIKHHDLGHQFIDSIMAARNFPWLLPLLLGSRRCLSTITMSHMGDPTKRFLATFPREKGKLVCGDVVLDKMIGVSPLRPQTRAAVSVVTMYRQLMINVRLDPHTMSLQDSRQFLDYYVERLQQHI
ncbi:MAG: hypothetical protein AAF497_06935 [Planctomycetota bacterium]